MRRSEWWPEAERLRAEGLRVGEIAKRVGVTSSAVSKALNPEARRAYNQHNIATRDRQRHLEVDRAYKRSEKARGRCIVCGDLMGTGYAVGHKHEKGWTCKPCLSAIRHERCLLIVKWWKAGETSAQIGERIGWTRNHLAAEFDRMRADGYELPYRYRLSHPRHANAASSGSSPSSRNHPPKETA